MIQSLDSPDLGPCCNCGSTGAVNNVVTLHQTAPIPGTGWGCFQCGLPMDGAIAVLCDGCLEQVAAGETEIKAVIVGQPVDGVRININDYEHQPFNHDLSKHPEARIH